MVTIKSHYISFHFRKKSKAAVDAEVEKIEKVMGALIKAEMRLAVLGSIFTNTNLCPVILGARTH